MYKAIFFDLDGTLTESGEGITKSVQYALEKLGVEAPDLKDLEVFVGPPLLEQFMKYAGFDKKTAEKAIEFYRERYTEKGMFENTVYPGVEETLSELKRRGYRLAVASAKPAFYVTQIMDHFNLSQYFEVIAGTDLNGPKITKSQVIEEALEKMNLSDHRDQVIMVGDREHDILGARKCDVQCVAVTYGYGSREELEKAQPLQIVDSAAELLNFFD
ncbi:HAD family hydrolase [Blautia sp. CLA-JM-H16]|uniref:HAD family hydrolase n=1 Tax=Blautia aquisgranensis TaxID=3133153 RepID=A0ABV1BB73_9FIRM